MSELLTHGNGEMINKCVFFFKKEFMVLLVTLTEVKWPATVVFYDCPRFGLLSTDTSSCSNATIY